MNIGRSDNQSIRPVDSSALDDFDISSKREKSSLFLPALRRVEFQPEDIKITEEKGNKGKNREKEDIFNELENNTILLKNSSSRKKYLVEKIENFPHPWGDLFEKGKSQNSSSSPENEDSSDEYSEFEQQRVEKILETYNRDYLEKLIKKDKDIISAISHACRGILNFVEKMANHLSSVSEEKKIQNMTCIKGLVFDNVA